MKNALFKSAGIFGLGLALVVSGCAKDQTASEYHQNQVNKEVARLQAISGAYHGTLINQADGTRLGVIEIYLESKLAPINSSDNARMDSQASLGGTVTIYKDGPTGVGVRISSASFISPNGTTNGNLVGKISVLLSNGTTANLAINGNVLGNTLSGVITTNDKVGIYGQFSTSKDVSLETVLKNFPAPTRGTHADIAKYVSSPEIASPTDSSDTSEVQMMIRNIGNTAAENFVNNFSLQRTVSIQLLLAPGIDGASFNSAELDLQNGVIHAQANNQGTIQAQVSLDCNQVMRNQIQAWSCTYSSNFSGGSKNFTVAVAKGI